MTRLATALSTALAIVALAAAASGDSGGPYEFVPDLREGEYLPTAAIDASVEGDLDFFVSHWPRPRADAEFSEPNRLEWEPVPADVVPSLVRIGRVGPQRLYAVRFVRREALNQGFDPAEAILVVADLPRDGRRYHPVFFTVGGATRDHTVSGLVRSGDLHFAIVRRHYDGQGNQVDYIALAWDAAARRFVRRDLAGGGDYWKVLRAEGWKPWSRGHGLDEESLTWIHHVYREPEGVPIHAVVRVPMTWDGERFRAGPPVFDEAH